MTVTLVEGAGLVDLLWVCHKLPANEREQWEAFAGEPYDAEFAAGSFYLRSGPKWTILAENEAIFIAGFDQIRPGVWQDWAFTTEMAWDRYWRPVTRIVRRVMDGMLRDHGHRLQCVSLASRVHAHKWYRPLGLELEGTLRSYGVNGEDALMFSRLRTP